MMDRSRQPLPPPPSSGQASRRRFLAVLGLAFLTLALSSTPSAATVACRGLSHRAATYTVCTVDLRSADLRLFWQDRAGQPFGAIRALQTDLASRGLRLDFAMNAGMYELGGAPVGLYIENGARLRPANTAAGPGNFHLKPNGIFFWKGQRAGVVETGRYLKERPAADFATQSGPMLVIDGRIHPAFIPDGTSLKIRNGVGVASPDQVVFAISEGPVNFYDFATLFRDALGCRNALFLDGSISVAFTPERGLPLLAPGLGPIVGVVAKK